jgi:hypothetical protein
MRIDSSGNLLVGTTTQVGENATGGAFNPTLSIKGSADGLIELISSRSDSADAGVGRLQSVFSNNNASHKIVAEIQTETEGTTANQRGGRIKFNTKADGSTGVTERMRIDSSGNVGIGTTTPTGQLQIYNASGTGGIRLTRLNNITDINMHLQTNSTSTLLNFYGDAVFRTNVKGDGTNAIERMRINSSGNVLIGKTSNTLSVEGIGLGENGVGEFTATGVRSLDVNRLSTDGDLVRFLQNTSVEGTISVSGATVSYNGFTGTHWSRFTDNSTPTILRGTVLESLDEMCDWYNLEFDVVTQDDDGNDVTTTEKVPHVLTDTQSDGDVITYNHEGTDYQATIVKENDVKHMMSKVSDTTDAKNVYGVFVAYDEDGEGYNDFYVASVGSFVVRIKANETIAKGDLLQSNGDGTAKVQTDDAVRSSSFAKVLSTTIIETYEDGSYLVPCSLMC